MLVSPTDDVEAVRLGETPKVTSVDGEENAPRLEVRKCGETSKDPARPVGKRTRRLLSASK